MTSIEAFFGNHQEFRIASYLARPLTGEDLASFHSLINEDSIRSQTSWPASPRIDQSTELLQAVFSRQEQKLSFFWGIFHHRTLAGYVSLANIADNLAEAGISYAISASHRGQGLASQAVAQVIRKGIHQLGLRQIRAFVFPGNPPSEKVLIQNGFRFDQYLADHFQKDDQSYDLKKYILRPDQLTSLYDLRWATDEDFELHRLFHRELKPYVEQIWGWDEQNTLAMLQQKWDPRHLQIIHHRGQSIGSLDVRTEPNGEIFIASILITNKFQGKGLGRSIIKDIIAEASKEKRKITLSVLRPNPAINLYKRLGFVVKKEDDQKFYMNYDWNQHHD